MQRAVVALFLLATLASPSAAQTRDCASLPGPSLATMPDELVSVHTAPDATVARAAAIEAMAASDPARPAAMFELAEAYRALARTADELRTLARIVQDHPTYPQLDRVQYRLARALERDHREAQARTVWLHMVRAFPTSPYLQAAYVAFGDLYLEQGQPELAQPFYEHALEAEGRWAAYAQYRLAWALARRGDRTALDHVRQALSALDASVQLDGSRVRSALGADQGALTATLACHP